MRIRHILSQSSCRAEEEGIPAFFLRAATGWFSLYTVRQSRYEGWFLDTPASPAQPFLKLLERVTYVREDGSTPDPVGCINTEKGSFWEYGDGMRLSYQLAPEQAGLTITALRSVHLRLTLDIRGIYSAPDLGRDYQVSQTEGGLLIRYTGPDQAKPVFLHIRGATPFSPLGEWQEAVYSRDTARHSPPDRLYVYEVAETITERLDLGAGFTEKEALAASQAATKQVMPMIGIGISHIYNTLRKQTEVARHTVEKSLEWLQSPKGLYAGLPWFHQVWSRDELIAALGLPPEQQLKIIERYLKESLVEGELPTFVGSGTTCADGLGWLLLLIREYGTRTLPEKTRKKLLKFSKTADEQLAAHRAGHHGLIWSGHNATWMDTIGREGFRLEIQLMYASLLELLYELTEDADYERRWLRQLSTVREQYYRNDYLWDGLGDPTKRPNVFLAYLFQPELLSRESWRRCFHTIIDATLCPWGGLTSLDTHHPSFQGQSTGQDNRSYHNGDSWFFVNNLAALALHRLNDPGLRPVILQLLRGSTNEILWKNMLGMPGEIAEANSGASWGCGIQAFSGGTYIALLKELEDYFVSSVVDSEN